MFPAFSEEVSRPVDSISPRLFFLDIPKFDSDLNAVLSRKSEAVDVNFYDPVSPNNEPERLQKWISAVEQAGGTVKVEPPPNDAVPKNPLVLLSLFAGLWSGLKALNEIKKERAYLAAANRNVAIVLDRDSSGQVVVKQITFSSRH